MLFVSSAVVFHCRPNVIVPEAHRPLLTAHWSCHRPWSWLFSSTVQAKVSPVLGFTASVPLKMGQSVEPTVPGFVGQNSVVRPAPGCAFMRVQVTPLDDW